MFSLQQSSEEFFFDESHGFWRKSRDNQHRTNRKYDKQSVSQTTFSHNIPFPVNHEADGVCSAHCVTSLIYTCLMLN